MDKRHAMGLLVEIERFSNSMLDKEVDDGDAVFYYEIFKHITAEAREKQWISEEAFLAFADLPQFFNEGAVDNCVVGCASTMVWHMLGGANYGGAGIYANLPQMSQIMAKLLSHVDGFWARGHYANSWVYFKNLVYKTAEDMLQKGWISEAAYKMTVNLEPYITADVKPLTVVGAAAFILRRFVDGQQRNPQNMRNHNENNFIYPDIKVLQEILKYREIKARGPADVIPYLTSVLVVSVEEAKRRGWVNEEAYDRIINSENYQNRGGVFGAVDGAIATFRSSLENAQRQRNRGAQKGGRQERRGRDANSQRGISGMIDQMREELLEELREEMRQDLIEELKGEIMDELRDEILEEIKSELE